jgi:diguanylate cyclase (GGDEF)-like protein
MKKVKILLINENKKQIDQIKDKLCKAGYESSHIRQVTGQTAFDLLKKERVDLILLDISPAEQADMESVRTLSQTVEDIPIVVLSDEENDVTTDMLLSSGVRDFLTSAECSTRVLSRTVRFALERQALTDKLTKTAKEVELLKESLEGIVRQNMAAILVVDRQNMVLYANGAAADIYGRLPEELRGSKFGHSISPGQTLETLLQSVDGVCKHVEMRGVEMMWEKRRAVLITIQDKDSAADADTQYIDSLTGVYNKAYLDEQAKLLDCPDNLPLCVIVGDLNNLQLINDTLGYQAGDRMLRTVADCFKSACLRESVVIRYGGDEFMVIQRRCNEQDAERIMEKILRQCKENSMEGFPVSIALGSAVKYSGDSMLLDDLLWIADEHMYAKKYTVVNPSKYSAVIYALEKSLYAKDYTTAMHTSRVRDLCVSFGQSMAMDSVVVNELILLSELHDIGKIALPSSILCKPGPLTPDEWETIKTHPEIGAKIAKVTHGMDLVALSILSHHERWDGKGYPNQRKGESIPLSARILSIVDSFDVMTHDRPYRRAMDEQEALEEIMRCSGTQFDPMLAEAFVAFFSARSGGTGKQLQ